MLRGGCILSHERQPGETLISVMSRHTDNSGKNADPRITPDRFDDHWTELGPNEKAIGAYYRHDIGWDEFANLYIVRLRENPTTIDKLAELVRRATEGNIVALCIEPTHEMCHRGLLLAHVSQDYPDVEVVLG
ncbi:MAG: hypothetical protein QG623_476 [Patescibacteria group bacterium]|nr:hypothetical protein [Patescibacteria group bacterium]